MAKDKISIKVAVEGADQTREKLDRVRKSASGVAGAHATSAAGARKAAKATQDAARANVQFDDSAKTAAAGLLGQLHPALGSLVSLAGDVVKGVGKITTTLVLMTAGAAALWGGVRVFGAISTAAERARQKIRAVIEAQREAAGESLSFQEKIADRLRGAGVEGRASEATDIAEELRRRGFRESEAAYGAAARVRYGLSATETDRLLGAYVATGPGGGAGQADLDPRTVLGLLRMDAKQARASLANYLADYGAGAVVDAPTPDANETDRLRAAAAAAMRKDPRFSEREVEVAEGLAAGMDPRNFRGYGGYWFGGPSNAMPGESVAEHRARIYAARMKFQPGGDGTTHTMAELVAALQDEIERIKGVQRAMGGGSPTAPMTLNYSVTYVDQQNVHREMGTPMPGAAELLDFGVD